MSRIGKKPVTITSGVSIKQEDANITVTGPKGELSMIVPDGVKVNINENEVLVDRVQDSKQAQAFHGLVRSLIANMVTGVSEGYTKKLEMVGTGYRAKKQGSKIVLSAGFSHPVEYEAQEGVTLDVEGETIITVSGIDKQKVGHTAAEIRAIRKPEPYKGKGIKYQGEYIIRKSGKATKA